MQALLFRAGMLLQRHRHWRPLEALSQQPAVAQMAVLQKLMQQNRHTSFGQAHAFSQIHNHQQLLQRVPVQEYETLRPYIDEQRLTGKPTLTAQAPLFYAQTSGTTGKPKLIPITPSIFTMHRDEQSLFSYLQYRACPQAFSGKALGIMSAAIEGHLDSGHVVGSVSGHLYESLPQMIQSRFVLPPEVSAIADYDTKYMLMLRLMLAEPDITYAGSPNPSTFLRLLSLLNARREELTKSLGTGKLPLLNKLDQSLRARFAKRIAPDPKRAAQLEKLSELSYANLWPALRLLTTWTGGSCGAALTALRTKLPATTRIMELGYQSSECRGSIALDCESAGGLPPLHHHFFEFVKQAQWDDNNAEFLTLEQIEPGHLYYIIVTTAAGLYRYFMNDLVEVTGFFNRTPLLRFVQKGKGVTSLIGEKLYENHVLQAIQDVVSRTDLVSSFFLMVADEAACSYRLFIEAETVRTDLTFIQTMVDRRLGELNIEYQAKRDSGRLAPLTLTWLRSGTMESYKAVCVQAGQREGQFKPKMLQYRKDLLFDIESYALRP